MHTINVYKVCRGFGWHVNNGSLSLTSMQWKPMESITGTSYCLKIVSCYMKYCSKTILFHLGKQHISCIVHATQSNCCNKKLSIYSQWRTQRDGGMPPCWTPRWRQLWACELDIHHFWSQKMATSGYYINTVKTAFKWKTNHRKFFII